MTVIHVVRSQQDGFAFDPFLQLRLCCRTRGGLDEIVERNLGEGVGGPGVIDRDGALLVGGNFVARRDRACRPAIAASLPRNFSAARNAMLRSALSAASPGLRRFDQFLTAHEIVGIDREVRHGRSAEGGRQHVERHREGGVLLVGLLRRRRRRPASVGGHGVIGFGEVGVVIWAPIWRPECRRRRRGPLLSRPASAAPGWRRRNTCARTNRVRETVQRLVVDADEDDIVWSGTLPRRTKWASWALRFSSWKNGRWPAAA